MRLWFSKYLRRLAYTALLCSCLCLETAYGYITSNNQDSNSSNTSLLQMMQKKTKKADTVFPHSDDHSSAQNFFSSDQNLYGTNTSSADQGPFSFGGH